MAFHAPPENLSSFPVEIGRRYVPRPENVCHRAIRVVRMSKTTELCEVTPRTWVHDWLSVDDIRAGWVPAEEGRAAA